LTAAATTFYTASSSITLGILRHKYGGQGYQHSLHAHSFN